MRPGHGEVLVAEGDPAVEDEERLLVAEFRRQLDEGMWAAVPTLEPANGRREARMVLDYSEVPRDADRVIFFPRAAGG
jgi:hypothetical protein